jgi:hypothetical protein
VSWPEGWQRPSRPGWFERVWFGRHGWILIITLYLMLIGLLVGAAALLILFVNSALS